MINEKEQEFIYDLYKKWNLKERLIIKEKNYKMIERLHKLGLIRKIKMPNTNEQELELTDSGKLFGNIISIEKGDFSIVKWFRVDYW